MPIRCKSPAPGTFISIVSNRPIGRSVSVSMKMPPRERFTEYATRKLDAVLNSTCTEYGIRSNSRSGMQRA